VPLAALAAHAPRKVLSGRWKDGMGVETPWGKMRVRALGRINASRIGWPGSEGVVPLAVKICWLDVEGSHLGIGDLDALLVSTGVDPAGDGEAGLGAGIGDQLDDDLMADQRLAAPILGDEGEQAVLGAVPLAGAGRQMADGDGDAEFIGQGL
jgi:hypothetical protein